MKRKFSAFFPLTQDINTIPMKSSSGLLMILPTMSTSPALEKQLCAAMQELMDGLWASLRISESW